MKYIYNHPYTWDYVTIAHWTAHMITPILHEINPNSPFISTIPQFLNTSILLYECKQSLKERFRIIGIRFKELEILPFVYAPICEEENKLTMNMHGNLYELKINNQLLSEEDITGFIIESIVKQKEKDAKSLWVNYIDLQLLYKYKRPMLLCFIRGTIINQTIIHMYSNIVQNLNTQHKVIYIYIYII